MSFRTRWAVVAVVATATVVALGAAVAGSSTPDPADLTSVPTAQPKAPGIAAPNVLSPQLTEVVAAQGSNRLENGTPEIPFYGYLGDGPHVPVLNSGSPPDLTEATKTEPDKNTYLVLDGQQGADPGFDYGRHFLFQGHEGAGEITRINLDADGAHRVTLMASTDDQGNPLPEIDGSTWDPFAHRLLFSAELNAPDGGIWQGTLDVPSDVQRLDAIGSSAYEGIQNDPAGELWIIEDNGGANGTAAAGLSHSRQPNSFVYRFVPDHRDDLTSGKLQALQVTSNRTGKPIVFHPGEADADIASQDTIDLHSYGNVFKTRWITLHDTGADGTAPFDAAALAKADGATPFKRPENGQFQPGTKFRSFFFNETGDTDARTEIGAAGGGFGTVQHLTQSSPTADTGTLQVLFQAPDPAHSSFDNMAFFSRNIVGVVEDAGDTLHTQRNALDSGYLLDTNVDYSRPNAPEPVRFVAEGRDASATLDSGLSGVPGFQNEGDNELTGIHVSDGDPTAGGLLGAKTPRPWRSSGDGGHGHGGSPWRVFYTAQHGDNVTWEIIPAR